MQRHGIKADARHGAGIHQGLALLQGGLDHQAVGIQPLAAGGQGHLAAVHPQKTPAMGGG